MINTCKSQINLLLLHHQTITNMKTRINKAYNEFRNNIAPLMSWKVEIGSMTVEQFENWFDKREATFFALMGNN